MKKIALLIYEDAVLSSVSGAIDLLMATNGFLQQQGKPPAFELELVSEKGRDIPLRVPAHINCSQTIDTLTDTDLVIVPAFYISPEEALQRNKRLISWIGTMREQGKEIASLCMGSYFLAEAGILDGRSCASHWTSINDMQQRFPQVTVLADMVITDKDGIYTSGGALLSWNLILYLIEKFCGREVSISVSKMFNIDLDKAQSHFVVFQGQHSHEDEEILQAQTFIEENYQDPISIEQVAAKVNMSKRNFIRRFKHATRNTPQEYLQRVKIESAKKALERSDEAISSLMFNSGYNDVKAFRKVFKQITGLTPQDYRKKYNKEVVNYV